MFSDTWSSHMPFRFINYKMWWFSVNVILSMRFLQKKLTYQQEFAAVPTDNNLCLSLRWHPDLLLFPIFCNELKINAHDRIWVWRLGVVSEHTVHESHCSAPRDTNSKWPKWADQNYHMVQSIWSLGVEITTAFHDRNFRNSLAMVKYCGIF